MFNRRAVFLDRDGTLIHIIHRPDHLKPYTAPFFVSELVFSSDVHESLKAFKALEFLRIMVTNQPDVANGYMSESEWLKIHHQVIGSLDLDDFMMCRHTTQDGCRYKKPSPDMLFALADKWGINLSDSYMIGDTDNDTKAGKSAGCGTILLDRSYNQNVEADIRVANLMDAVKVIKLSDHLFR